MASERSREKNRRRRDGERDAIPAKELTTMEGDKARVHPASINRIPKNVT
jgi:hypothetical protein